jgi:hypothetical protein
MATNATDDSLPDGGYPFTLKDVPESTVEPWTTAGLEAVKMVYEHEKTSMLVRSPEPGTEPQAPTPEPKTTAKDTTKLVGYWMPDPTPPSEPEPEPEPEPRAPTPEPKTTAKDTTKLVGYWMG